MASEAPHMLTLMVDTQRAWLTADAGCEPSVVELRCQECDTYLHVPMKAARRGAYFCGAWGQMYRKHQDYEPGISEALVDRTGISGTGFAELTAILGGLRQSQQALEAWIYRYVHVTPTDDAG